ncbi:hypothetical protein MBM_09507 [Drepanopeziza brunnea f. sp. 'multigermtubi' MB_m1]|uniref:Uncharacterized protein n=1 Tax=Marssonina brunnea f. sp. multigermtubi (strain MB_m1) TaxID=1072389 RepID=K1WJD9_MARBU|nr:uncharacterized protein MBM_09507 [Drepanopeziza brunnea f. sp. 'multigermtubi' MB_m1]EKD12332.1 hypothetical protein MBM_09507 [Drepanopeziza brunnea f. sp. 'multigermtubi' MB_m1]
MSASRLRTISQVWPPWLPGAIAGVENLSSALSSSCTTTTATTTLLPALATSASFKPLSSSTLTTSESRPAPNRRLRPTARSAFSHQSFSIPAPPAPQYQQTRAEVPALALASAAAQARKQEASQQHHTHYYQRAAKSAQPHSKAQHSSHPQ